MRSIRKHINTVGLPAVWIVYLLIAYWNHLDNGLFLLFRVGKDHIHGDEPYYSQYEVWQMHAGTLALIGLAVFGSLLAWNVCSLFLRPRRAPSEAQP